MKTLFDDADSLTVEGIDLECELGYALRPIFDKYIDLGYSPRQIAYIAVDALQHEKAVALVNFVIKERDKAQKSLAPFKV